MTKTILCYGDSNTWGYTPNTSFDVASRFDVHTRWAGVLRDTLGEGYWVVEEGLGGRTTVWEDPIMPNRNGAAYLLPCLESHQPIELVVLMLGTNDLKHRFGKSAYDIARGAGVLVEIIQRSMTAPDEGIPDVLLICPPPTTSPLPALFADQFEGAVEKSRQLWPQFQQVAQDFAVQVMNAGDIIESCPVDGIHFDAAAHRALGEAVAQRVIQFPV